MALIFDPPLPFTGTLFRKLMPRLAVTVAATIVVAAVLVAAGAGDGKLPWFVFRCMAANIFLAPVHTFDTPRRRLRNVLVWTISAFGFALVGVVIGTLLGL